MKQIYPLFPLLLFCLSLKAQAPTKTIYTSDFEQDGARLIINFEIETEDNEYTYNLSRVFIYGADAGRIEVESYTGDRLNLRSGNTYKISWDVLADVDAFDSPTRAELQLDYTIESQRAIVLEQQRAQEAEEAAKKQEVKVQRKLERKQRKPFRLGLAAYGSYSHGLFEYFDFKGAGFESLHNSSMYGFGGGGITLEFRVARYERNYLQIEGAYVLRRLAFNNYNDTEYHGFPDASCLTTVYYASNSHVIFHDQRIKALYKFSFGLQFGGYYAIFNRAERTGGIDFYEQCGSSTIDQSYNSVRNRSYDLADENLFPEDSDGNRPLQPDYGVILGWENPTHHRLIIGIGGELSLTSILNSDYRFTGNNPQEYVDFDFRKFSYGNDKSINLMLFNAYLKVGIRL